MLKLKTVDLNDDEEQLDLFGEDGNPQPDDAQPAEAEPEANAALAEADQPKPDDEFWEQLQIVGSLVEIEAKRVVLEGEIEAKENEVDAAKAALKELVEDASDLKQELSELTEQVLALSRELLQKSGGKNLPSKPADKTGGDDTADDGWRNRLTSSLLAGIKGMSQKKLDTLCELAPDVGHLEDLRAEASKEHAPFHSKLPRGIGKSVAEQIEDRLMDHIASYAKSLADPDRAALADELLEEVRAVAEEHRWDESDCVPVAADDEHTHDGFTAFNSGKKHDAFLSMDREKARAWMVGWVGAERLKAIKEL